jgi:multimeric flavodoxin WrbA
MSKTLIVLGSSRSNGETRQMVDYLLSKTDWELLDLKPFEISHYDYEHKNSDDDFSKIIIPKLLNAERIIVATPVYWYSMSGIMKVFFDRLTDLITISKSEGRQLRGKSLGVISCSSEGAIKDGFYMPFEETANYLGMSYIGKVHSWLNDDKIPESVQNRLDEFYLEVLSH